MGNITSKYKSVSLTDDEQQPQLSHNDHTFSNYDGFLDIYKINSVIVCVTGASGFIGSHCVRLLLSKGYTVHGTIRGDPDSEQYQWLHTLSSTGTLKLFKADLLNENSFDLAVKRCDFVFHIASPLDSKTINRNNVEQKMIQPAINGTLNVLSSCLKNDKLKRVVLTSSMWTIYNHSKLANFNESDWNDEDNIDSNPYAFSKAAAEREAWNWMERNSDMISFDMISILPPIVLGAQLKNPSKLVASNVHLYHTVKGRIGKINCIFPMADVRDVAAMHLFFVENKKALEQGKGRYILWGDCPMQPMVVDEVNEYCIVNEIKSPIGCCKSCCLCDYWYCAKCCLCCVLLCCSSNAYRSYNAKTINLPRNYANDSKAKALGFKDRNWKTTIHYTLDYFVQQNIAFSSAE